MSLGKEAYLLFSFSEQGEMKDFGKYVKAANPLLEKHGGELLVAGAMDPSISKFEGDWPKGAGLTLIRFPSRENLEDFWKSDEYQSIVDLRTAILPANFTIGFSNGWGGEAAT